MQIADEVPDGSGADSRQGKADEVPVQMADESRRFPGQIADEVLEGFRRRWQTRFPESSGAIAGGVLEVPAQMADEVSNSLAQTRFWRVPDG